jgi:hypothetical protein
MADLSSVQTLLDVGKMYLNKDLLPIVELLHKRNGILRFSGWELANQLTSHIFSKEAALPDAAERAIGEGSVSQNAQVSQGTEDLSYIEGKSRVDIIFRAIHGAKFPEYRLKKDTLNSEGFGQGIATRIFYGTGAPGKVKGLATRYPNIGSNVRSAGGAVANANTSLWVIQPGDGKCNFLVGEGAKPGSVEGEFSTGFLSMTDLGILPRVTDVATGADLLEFVTLFEIFMGLCVYRDDAVQRLCNINTTTGDGEVDPDQVIDMIDSLPDPEGEKYIFCNKMGRRQLKKNTLNKTLYTQEADKYGQMRDVFYNAQIVITEAITNVEAVAA